MAETTTNDNGGNSAGSAGSSPLAFIQTPLGMGLAAGIALALIAGYMIL